MNDDSDRKLDRLFAAAREAEPGISAQEEHFETRLIARIRESREKRQAWPSWSWRLVPVFTAVVAILGIASVIMENAGPSDMFAAITNGQESYLVTSYLAGE